MCRWVVYRGRPVFLDTLVTEPSHSLLAQSLKAYEAKIETNGDGFGIGWYGEREEPGLFREPFPAWNDDNLKSLCRQIASPFFFAHVRSSTGTAVSRANCHPFVVGRWMFMHNGQVGGYQRVRRRLENAVPEQLYRFRSGTTDSELLFLMALAFAEDGDVVDAMRRALSVAAGAMREAGTEEPLRFTAALGNGDTLYAFRFASDGLAPSLYYKCTDGGAVVVSEPLDSDQSGTWMKVPQGAALKFSPAHDCEPQISPFAL
jgi:predicted glutamine amidotransferase